MHHEPITNVLTSVHMCNQSGPFNDSVIEYLAKFPMVTIEKGQGINATEEPYASLYVEDKIINACQRVKAINSSIICILYYNSILDWPFYRLHEEFVENPSYWLRDDNNQIVLLQGDHTFPQPPQGMLVPDYTQQIVSDFWVCSVLKNYKFNHKVYNHTDLRMYQCYKDWIC